MKQILTVEDDFYENNTIKSLFENIEGLQIVAFFPNYIEGCDMIFETTNDFNERELQMSLTEFLEYTKFRRLLLFKTVRTKTQKE